MSCLCTPISHRRTPTIERFFGLSFGSLYYSAPFVYQLSGNGVTVYDITSSNQIKRIGHYAAGHGFSGIVSLPHNRVVLAGDRAARPGPVREAGLAFRSLNGSYDSVKRQAVSDASRFTRYASRATQLTLRLSRQNWAMSSIALPVFSIEPSSFA